MLQHPFTFVECRNIYYEPLNQNRVWYVWSDCFPPHSASLVWIGRLRWLNWLGLSMRRKAAVVHMQNQHSLPIHSQSKQAMEQKKHLHPAAKQIPHLGWLRVHQSLTSCVWSTLINEQTNWVLGASCPALHTFSRVIVSFACIAYMWPWPHIGQGQNIRVTNQKQSKAGQEKAPGSIKTAACLIPFYIRRRWGACTEYICVLEQQFCHFRVLSHNSFSAMLLKKLHDFYSSNTTLKLL